MIQLHNVFTLMKKVISMLVFCVDRIAGSDSWQTSEGLKTRKR